MDKFETKNISEQAIKGSVEQWVETVVVGLNFCPFAKREVSKERLRYRVTGASSEEELLQVLQNEINLLDQDTDIETSLIIHPNVLQNFYDYNQFLDYADLLLEHLDRNGIYQVASFHPDYQYADTEPQDIENYRNKSPYPMLHLLREESLERAIVDYPDTMSIPEQNIKTIQKLGRSVMQGLLKDCEH